MADVRANFPNLKISVDNTASSDESDNDVEIHNDNDEEDSEGASVLENEKSESEDGEIDKDDVEFNVRLSSFAGHKVHNNSRSGSVLDQPDDKTIGKLSDKRRNDKEGPEKRKHQVLPQQRVYVNKSGTFVTGIDVTSQEALEKREERARRFGVQQQGTEQSQMNISLLYESLDLQETDFENEELGLRQEALHMYGTDDMSTNDVFDYFTEFAPSAIEWINDVSCNVVWLDKVTATRALLKLSVSYDVAMANLQAAETNKSKHWSESNEKEDRGENSIQVNSSESNTHIGLTDVGIEGSKIEMSSKSEEKMEVEDDDELDLEGDGDTGHRTNNKRTIKESEKASRKTKDDGKGSQKDKREEREKGERIDCDSSKKKSASGSPSASSSKSESTDGSDSSLGAASESESSSEAWDVRGNKKKKDSDMQEKETHEMPSAEEISQKRKKLSIPWPPGKWRLGVPCKKRRYLFLRFATKADKKIPGAEKKSRYYQKYGNPNYGGMKGLISESRKRKLRYAQIDKELKSKGPDARDRINQSRSSKKKQKGNDGDHDVSDEDQKEEGEISPDEGEVEVDEEEVKEVVIETPKDLRQLLNRETAGIRLTLRNEQHDLDSITSQKKTETGKKGQVSVDDEDEMDFEAELEHLLEEPPKKRYMRMHADDEEDRIKAKRAKAGMLTVMTASQGGVRSRLGERVQQHDIRTFEDEEEGEVLNDQDDSADEDFDSVDYSRGSKSHQSSGVVDLRSKLSARKKDHQEPKRESIRIEVFD